MTTDDAIRSSVEPATGHELPDLAKLVKTFPVRDGEKPWTVKEVTAIADELIAEIARLEVELSEADAELSALLRNSGDAPATTRRTPARAPSSASRS